MSRFVSTRGEAPSASFSETLLQGLAPDGGLFAPETWPTFSPDALSRAAGTSYPALAASVLRLFCAEELSPSQALADCEAAYGGFRHPATTPLRQLDQDLWLLELFHGPTLAFKDVAMQLLARLYERFLAPSGRRLTIVCATSGDTGGAAVEAFRGSPAVRLAVLYPEGRISEVQRRFMTSAGDGNVLCLEVRGDFDDCQALVKALFADRGFVRDVDLSGVNSINLARIIAQSVYYLAAGAILGSADRPTSFVVPTGNFGNAFAGYAAARMGAPIRRITAAVNANDILAAALGAGLYRRGAAVATMSPAMDIQVASNFERLYFETSGRDAGGTASAFAAFHAGGDLSLPAEALRAAQGFFTARSVSEAQTAETMSRALRRYGELIDPHTAVALHAAEAGAGPGPRVVLATAHPAKFPDAVEAATGRRPSLPEACSGLYDRPETFEAIDRDLGVLTRRIREFASA